MSHSASRRIALGVEYQGTAYAGWQAQRAATVRTVQETLDGVLTGIAAEHITTVCAGRTDTGVHAAAQVVHFDTFAQREPRAWTLGVNSRLPADIAIRWAAEVPNHFHARFSALRRRYRYVILNRPLRTALAANSALLVRRQLDVERMHQAAQVLMGERDFSSFRAAGCQSRTPMRRVEAIAVCRVGDLVVIDITANAFVHHMVRNISGSLLAVGLGERDSDWLAWLLEARDRRLAAATAPAHGLYLVAVDYPEEFSIPLADTGPWFLEKLL